MDATRKSTILNTYGFHARPSTTFATLANTFDSTISVEVNGNRVDGKSVMMLMTLGAEQGTELHIHASGDDAEAAVEALKEHVAGRFGVIE